MLQTESFTIDLRPIVIGAISKERCQVAKQRGWLVAGVKQLLPTENPASLIRSNIR